MNTITLTSPFDAHVHLREQSFTGPLSLYSASTFSGAMVMPNLKDPLIGRERILTYRKSIEHATGPIFNPYMTAYFREDFTEEYLKSIQYVVKAVKFYPKGVTTNSDYGADPGSKETYRILEIMEKLGMTLCVHPELKDPGDSICVTEREQYFMDEFIHPDRGWAAKFPGLKIVLEHITSYLSIHALRRPNVYATVTVHHLLTTLNDVIGGNLDPHLFCKPIPKGSEDRESLAALVIGDPVPWFRFDSISHKVMLGTDSAPHSIAKKTGVGIDWMDNTPSCGCAGVFTAPIALQLLAEVFWKSDPSTAQKKMQRFVSDNAVKFYGLNLPKRKIVLTREPFTIPYSYEMNDFDTRSVENLVVPMWAGRQIPWSVYEEVEDGKSKSADKSKGLIDRT